jgi:hypothetical protein
MTQHEHAAPTPDVGAASPADEMASREDESASQGDQRASPDGERVSQGDEVPTPDGRTVTHDDEAVRPGAASAAERTPRADAEQDAATDDEPPTPPRREVARVAEALRLAVLVLSVPATLLAVVVLLLVAAVVGVSLGALLIGGFSWLGLVALLLALAAIGYVIAYLARVVRYRRAVAPASELAADLQRLLDLRAITTTTMAHLVELSSPRGGLRPFRRARALWRVLRTADTVEEHVTSHERARWFVPPDAALTWLLTQVLVVLGVLALLAGPALATVFALR